MARDTGLSLETYRDCSIGRGLTGANWYRLADPEENTWITCVHIEFPRGTRNLGSKS